MSVYWPVLVTVLSTCTDNAMWYLTTWSSLSVNATDSTQPVPVQIIGTKMKNQTIWFDCYQSNLGILFLWLNIRLTKRLSNFFASVMWIQLSFSMTLMCFTSSLNLWIKAPQVNHPQNCFVIVFIFNPLYSSFHRLLSFIILLSVMCAFGVAVFSRCQHQTSLCIPEGLEQQNNHFRKWNLTVRLLGWFVWWLVSAAHLHLS